MGERIFPLVTAGSVTLAHAHMINCPISQIALFILAIHNIIIMSYCFSKGNYCRIETLHLPVCVCRCINKEPAIK